VEKRHQQAVEGWLVITKKHRYLRKFMARINSKFVLFRPACCVPFKRGACNRTPSWLVVAPPSTTGFQPKSRHKAYRNGVELLDELSVGRRRSNRSHATRRIETGYGPWPALDQLPRSNRSYATRRMRTASGHQDGRCNRRFHGRPRTKAVVHGRATDRGRVWLGVRG
jgi:hypothetical protein